MSEVRDDLADLFARVRGHQASLLDDERRAAVRQRLAYMEPAQARMSSRL